MNIEKIKLLVDLTKAKIDILKLKADDYTWACHVDEVTKSHLLDALKDIDELISKLE